MDEHTPQVEDDPEGTNETDQESPEGEQSGAPAHGISGTPPDASVQLGNPDPEHGGAH